MDEDKLQIAPGDLSPREAYRLLVSVVVPRPIAWVSSVGGSGTLNLAPFSFFNVVGDDPPTVMISIGEKRGGGPKDTLRNVYETGEMVINIAGFDLAEKLNLSSGEWQYEASEFDLAGLQTVPSVDVRPPRVAEAPISLEVKVSEVLPVKGTGYTMVLGHVVRYHIRRDLVREDGLVDSARLQALARLGGDDYTWVERTFSMKRPRVGD